jgi:hypothetical protein
VLGHPRHPRRDGVPQLGSGDSRGHGVGIHSGGVGIAGHCNMPRVCNTACNTCHCHIVENPNVFFKRTREKKHMEQRQRPLGEKTSQMPPTCRPGLITITRKGAYPREPGCLLEHVGVAVNIDRDDALNRRRADRVRQLLVHKDGVQRRQR